jgi:phage protein D
VNVPKPTYEIVYNGKNITTDILPYVLSFSFSDKASGESDELEIVVEDSEGLWRNEWYPLKGDFITARIISIDGELQCGKFTVDEMSATGGSGGDTVTIKALAAGINKKTRTKKSSAHESKTLREIANTIAAQNGLKVSGNIANITINRATQRGQTDLHFLHRLASEYGYTFSVRDNLLVFTKISELEKKKAAFVLTDKEIISWSITDKTAHTFQAVKISYHNPKEKEVIEFEHKEDSDAFKTAKSDILVLKIHAENRQQAEIKAKAALYKVNSLQQEGSVEIPGNMLAVAGNNCELVGLGVFSGLYYINGSTHSVSKDGGYSTSLEIKRVGLLEKKKEKPASSSSSSDDFTPSKESILPELTIIFRAIQLLISGRKEFSLQDLIEKIDPTMEKSLDRISSKGHFDEAEALDNIYQQIKEAAGEEKDAEANKKINVEMQLILAMTKQEREKKNAK